MRTAGLQMSNIWAGRIQREPGTETFSIQDLPAELVVLVQTMDLQHHGPDVNYRPYLHLTGELRSVRPSEPLACGITEVTYAPGVGEQVDAFYEFDDAQLVELTQKGYFTAGFSVPDHVLGIEWELPATIDALVLAPSAAYQDAAVVFTNIRHGAELEIDLATSGYDLAAYFSHQSPDRSHSMVVDDDELRVRSTAINSLFTEEDYAMAREEAVRVAPAPKPKETEPSDALDVSEVEAAIAAERAEYQAQLSATTGTLENLFHEHVAWTLNDETTRPEEHGDGSKPSQRRNVRARRASINGSPAMIPISFD